MWKIKLCLNELLYKHNLTIHKLHLLTGIRRATLSELANGKRQRIQFEHIEKIANALNINNINEILTLESVTEIAGVNNDIFEENR
ncbi:helix-turn-helix domain-containing protein [Anaerobacillus isosaccharinicus]|uniref:Helix-turn-helix domain-containing protein n=1 Tax=Anaerobacillus isosaccharinicus TaxID=1532552 RepID=A0A1S2LT92_9BACI|nr:helix-turn-helix domain-containing protein [Anaerobacillus isosaccharinicus]MBA5584435.1 helix-turn-helix domain-containing protein [Anaerobacillus isosaccharinicus]QOY37177.1 helix-turn-helix domain-containing protein [Anaerobacillus isosaccharinicus]